MFEDLFIERGSEHPANIVNQPENKFSPLRGPS